MPSLVRAALVLTGLVACGGQSARQGPPPSAPGPTLPSNASLYKRLGGYDALAAVTDDFLGRMLGDPKMAAYFENVDERGLQRVRQMIVDQLCAATGGPCVYVGGDMPTVHKDMQISETAWTVAVGYLTDTLTKFQVPEREKAEVLGFVSSLKSDIVGK